jgi:asparagine synthase (glutamine-hydrolysing)
VPTPFSPGLSEPKIVDLSHPEDDLLLGASREGLEAAVRAGDVEALARIDGCFAAVARDGVTVRLARTLGRPLRYFVAKRSTGPYLVVADRIDDIARYCAREGISWQFHPSYTRMAPAHYLTELDQVGCPDPNPRYRRFFSPRIGREAADVGRLGELYVRELRATVARIVEALPAEEPIAVALSGGADSSAVAAALESVVAERGQAHRLRFYTLSVGGGDDSRAARAVAEALGAAGRWHLLEAADEDIDVAGAVASIEDYRPLDVQCAAVSRAFLRRLREREPDLTWLFDGDGGDENWKSYPVEDSDLTIRSVLNNPLLYHEGWGVDSIKHSLTYSGGLSRGIVRGLAPAREEGFRVVSPHTWRPAVAAALAAPLAELVGEDLGRLYELKGRVVARGLAAFGVELPIAPKKRFQEGATSGEVFRRLAAVGRSELRRLHEERFVRLGAETPEAETDRPGGAPSSPGRFLEA